MKKLITHNTFSNIIISFCIGLSYYFLDENMAIMYPGKNPIVGIFMLALIVLAMPFGVIKAGSVSFNAKSKLTQVELFFIIMLYFVALFTTVLIVYMACALIAGGTIRSDNMLVLFFSIAGLAVLFFLWECWVLFIKPAKKKPQKVWVKVSNLIYPLYSAIAIAIFWESAFDISWESDPNNFRKVFLSCVMAITLILPFQRLFWFETFIDSSSFKENMISLWSLGLSVGVAVAYVL